MWNMAWLYGRFKAWLCVKWYLIGLKEYISGYRYKWYVYAIDWLVIIVLSYSRKTVKDLGETCVRLKIFRKSNDIAKRIMNESWNRTYIENRVYPEIVRRLWCARLWELKDETELWGYDILIYHFNYPLLSNFIFLPLNNYFLPKDTVFSYIWELHILEYS